MTAIERLSAVASELSARMDTLREEMKAKAEEVLLPALRSYLDEHPEIHAIGWVQYAPHFNDGDACVFHVREARFRMVDPKANRNESDDEPETGPWNGGYSEMADGYGGSLTDTLKNDLRSIDRALSDVEDALEDMYGDGMFVCVTRDGVTTDEYDHD